MKKIVFIFLLIFILTIPIWFKIIKPSENQEVLTTQTKKKAFEIKRLPHGKIIDAQYKDKNFKILAIEASSSSDFTLIPNFTEKDFGETLAQNYNCDAVINGGFYKEDYTPLGLFMVNNKRYGNLVKSRVANGFFYQSKNGERVISNQLTQDMDNVVFVLQTGPFIIVRNSRITITNDEEARRSLIGTDSENRLYLISIILKENYYSGPYLSDLPLIFSLQQVKKELNLTKLLNLDGGGASFFYSKDEEGTLTLPSISPIGSLICVKIRDKQEERSP